MAEINWVIHKVQGGEKDSDFAFFCPGCQTGHGFRGTPPNNWTFNGDLVKPTISPTILVRGVQPLSKEEWQTWTDTGTLPPKRPQMCHSFVNNGMIQFLGDCTHKIANQTVPLEPF